MAKYFFSRKGASFYPHFDKILSQLENMGMAQKWMDEVIDIRVRDDRATRNDPISYVPPVSLICANQPD